MTNFNVYTPATAPEKSRGLLKSWQERLGFTPNVVGVMAENPALLKGFAELREAYEGGVFSAIEREIINMTISSLNDCDYCLAAHSYFGEKAGVPKEIVNALREERPLKEPRLEALRVFVSSVMKKMGRPDDRDLDLFYKAGYTKAHVLEVILGWSLTSIGNYVSHIAAPALDKVFEPHRAAPRGGKKDGKAGGKSHAA